MARVTGPLMSIDASGTLANTLTFGKWKGRNYVRERVIPLNPKSAKQTGIRSMMGFLSQFWASIGTVSQATWDELAATKAISAFNAYVGENLSRWQNFFAPTQAHPAAEASTPLTVTTQTLTGGIGQCTVELTPSGATDIWGFVIFRDAAEITAPSWTCVIAVIPADGANAITHVDTPLEAGTYHYRSAVINTDGVMGTIKADDSEAVT